MPDVKRPSVPDDITVSCTCASPKVGYVLTKYDDLAASTRQRFLQFSHALAAASIKLRLLPLLPNDYLRRTFSGERYPPSRTMIRYIERVLTLAARPKPDFLWIQYDAFPFIPRILEALIYPREVPRIYDLDDAVFHQYEESQYWLNRRLFSAKFRSLFAAADLVICGNSYLHRYARESSSRAVIIPTVLDTSLFVPRRGNAKNDQMTVGWIGSPSTWKYVRPIFHVLEELQRSLGVRVRIVGSGPISAGAPPFEYLDWTLEREVEMIQGMDIGIMPLPDEPWARGKCGFKLIQYMSCGIPVVASPIGVNTELVCHGINGFLAGNSDEWRTSLQRLVSCRRLRADMGAAGREHVTRDYSLQRFQVDVVKQIRAVLDAAEGK